VAATPTIGPLPRKPHPLVAKGFTPIWVSDSLRKRAQAVWHGLLEIFASRGWAIEGREVARDHYTHSVKFTRLTVDGLEVFLRIRELRRQIKKANPGRWDPKTELVDSGLLAIDIDLSQEPPSWNSYSSKTMKETESRRLEERVGDLLEKLVHMVAKEKVRRAEAAEQRRLYELELERRRKEEARRKAEEDKWQDFRRLAEDWVAADHLRRFVTAIEERADELNQAIDADKIAWLRTRIADLDPLNHLFAAFAAVTPDSIAET
jgi:hypothetical protein